MQRIRDLVAAHLPDSATGPVRLLGAGADNTAYQVGDDLVVRFNHAPDAATAVTREARLLTAVAEISPIPVPRPVFTVPEQGCLAYRKLPGRPVLELPPAWQAAHGEPLGATVGDLLTVLHPTSPARFADLVEPDDTPLAEWRDEAAGHYATVAPALSAAHRAAAETFLAAPPPADTERLVFSHNDLGIEHLLADESTGAITGVIDWTDAALTDPAYDFGLLYRDLGPAALAAALTRYPWDDPALRERVIFHARCAALEDLAYGLTTGQVGYAAKSRAGFSWLFG